MKNFFRSILKWFSVQSNLSLVSSLASLFSVIIATGSLVQNTRSFEETLHAGRPYFSISETEISSVDKKNEFEISITTKNIGVRPASELTGKVIFIPHSLDESQIITSTFSSANEIPPNLNPTWKQKFKTLATGPTTAYYILIAVKYRDSIIDDRYGQVFYLTWPGIIQPNFKMGFMHLTLKEKIEVDKITRKLLPDYPIKNY